MFHPAVDPLLLEAPSTLSLRGGNPSGLGKTIDHVLAHLQVLGDLLKGHPPVSHSGVHFVRFILSRHEQSLGVHTAEVKATA